ncbi:MAG: imidazoleglycerol-phosphate dehydratase HisB [Deltaproteobacteria bacterium]|nr:imidazoleglycerol-phosphate dehydratase HisB [Candidatus Anaeroferrophillus wilburensis]MBN2888641.1 imidazoleglycerol-phosphate dehydratase HisB [Deltaproteobacteria bacterium]
MTEQNRQAKVARKTEETDIRLALVLDGQGMTRVVSGIPFMDHMLTLFGRHSRANLEVTAVGDLEVDFHHTVEDLGICLGQALAQALGDGGGITRYGQATIPMDEALCSVAVDLAKRPNLTFNVPLVVEKVGELDTELMEEFFRAFSSHSGMTLHINVHYGKNQHHIFEAVFKALAHALRQAWQPDAALAGWPLSTKGML